MEISNSQATYCSEAEEILMHSSEKIAECNALRRSKRLSQKPEKLNESLNWDSILLLKNKVRLRYKKKQQTQNSKDSSQFSKEKIDDCSLKKNDHPPASDKLNKRYETNLQSIDLIAELETPPFFDQLPQNQVANMAENKVAGDSPMDLRTKFRSLEENTHELSKNSRNSKVNQIVRKRKIFDPDEEAKLQKIEDEDMNERNNAPQVKNADKKTELLKQIPYSEENKVQLTPNSNPKKRYYSISQPNDDKHTQKKNELVVNARKKCKPMQKSRRGRPRKSFAEDLVFAEKQQHFSNIRTNVQKEETINEKAPKYEQIPLNTTINTYTWQPEACLPNFHRISTSIPDITATISEQTSLNSSSFELQNSNTLFVKHNDNQNAKFSSAQNIRDNSKSRNFKNITKINKYQPLRQKNITTTARKNIRGTLKDQESMEKISTKTEGTVYRQIPKITTIPLLPATTNSLLPKVYPPHFTGQLSAPISEPMPVRQLENAVNFNETQLILHCNRELNYWLTPELTQPVDEELFSSSTPSLTESLKDIFEADSIREILHIEKIVYRLGENHVKALAMILNIETEILHEILKHIVRLDEKILRNVNNMVETMSPTLGTFELNDSTERVEPNEMIISPNSSTSVEIIESPKTTQSRIFLSQRHTNVN